MADINQGPEQIHEAVRSAYGEVARTRSDATAATSCCGTSEVRSDYTVEEIASVPTGAYLHEGSGAPVRSAGLKPGHTVVDLGSGAGMDTFLAAQRVGPTGRVFGFDLTREMVERARAIAARAGFANVTFTEADIARLPLGDASADAAISNCVINLAPDKGAVYRELFRVLKPGGRISVADIVLRGPEQEIHSLYERASAGNWCACVAGALEEQEYLDTITAAGFGEIQRVAERPAQSQPGGRVRAVAVTLTAVKPA
ncbi:MAG: methyltransferase domain-containing protein [Candidatus Acidiferrales bacterium]